MKRLILASQSPDRKLLMERLKIPFEVIVSQYEEDMTLDLPPAELAIELSRGKAREVAGRVKDAVVIGADSFVVLDGELLGKPHTKERAREMLRQQQGRQAVFITGLTIIDTESGREVSEAVETKVWLRKLTDAEIDAYIEREDDVLTKAGAYCVRTLGSALVDRIEGDMFNVSGLPVGRVVELLKGFEITAI